MNTTSSLTFARRALCGGLFLLCTSALACSAQTAVTVHIDADKPINVMTTEAMGVYTDLYDSGTVKPVVAQYLHAAGMYTIQYPGGTNNSGVPTYPDLYHWSTGGGSKYMNVNPQPEFFYPSESGVASIANFLDKLGTAVITVNYGSNLAGTGGGEPNDAAALVAYMNGDPASTQVIGKDSTGHDWKTVGYWAGLRAAAPLATDDGLNLLRANHPKPLKIQLWQIGSAVYNNGYYGSEHSGEEDLHAPYPATEKENEKRKGNPNLSPAYYGERVVEFSKAMKAVDPSIWISATLVLGPDDYHWAPDWNRDVLKAACAAIDFESLTWVADARISVDPYNVMDEPATLQLPEKQLGPIFSEVIYNNKKFCPAGRSPRVAFTQMAPIRWAKVNNHMVYGLFAADAFALLAESGVINSDWLELHDPNFLTGSNTPGPGYYGAQMLHIVAFHPGDQFVTTTSSSETLSVHATHRTDGALGVLLVNKDSSTPAAVKISVGGGSFATQGTRFDYGQDNLKVLSPVTRTPIKVDSMTFTVTVAPYTITDIVLPKAP
jgi:hypothetical protein